MAAEDRALVYKMVGVGIGLVVILSLYLVIMTHKVAGPLYKVSMYFDQMARGQARQRHGACDKGDMLQDFFGNFKEMHEAVRTRAQVRRDHDGERRDRACARRPLATQQARPRRSTRSTSTSRSARSSSL